MSNNVLLPNKYKTLGWFILIPATILGIILAVHEFGDAWMHAKVFAIAADGEYDQYKYFTISYSNITNTVVGGLFIIGALLVGFSKEKQEDEFIAELRLSSLLWAVIISYLLLLVAFVFVYGTPFLDVMIYNMFTVLIIFIVRFNIILYKNSKSVAFEK